MVILSCSFHEAQLSRTHRPAKGPSPCALCALSPKAVSKRADEEWSHYDRVGCSVSWQPGLGLRKILKKGSVLLPVGMTGFTEWWAEHAMTSVARSSLRVNSVIYKGCAARLDFLSITRYGMLNEEGGITLIQPPGLMEMRLMHHHEHRQGHQAPENSP